MFEYVGMWRNARVKGLEERYLALIGQRLLRFGLRLVFGLRLRFAWRNRNEPVQVVEVDGRIWL